MAQIGLDKVYYALLTDDAEDAVTYEAPKELAPSITATITSTNNTTTLYADDQLFDIAQSKGQKELSLNVADMESSVEADLLGKTINTNGEIVESADDEAPYVALLFRSRRHDGSYKYVKLLKGKFRQDEEAHNTKGESVEYTTPTVIGTFIPREFDKQFIRKANENDGDFSGGDAWFDNVEPTT